MPATLLDYPASLPTAQQTLAQQIPTVAEDAVTGDVYVDCAVFNVTGASALTVTLMDKQGSPVEVFRLEVDPKLPGTWNPAKRVFFKGGINWVASGAGLNGILILSR